MVMVEANLVKRSRISSSCTIASTLTDAAKDIPPTPSPPDNEEYDISKRFFELPIPFQKALTDDNELNDDDEKIFGKVAQSTLQPRPLLPPSRQIVFPRENATYPSHTKRLFLTTINMTMTTTKKMTKLREGTYWS